ncbi:MAG: AraC family transcriptional regulator [Leptospiraceae bacterium]|nr:AraC family transcriptional regulator [Leptospiraceae bacterium]
MLQLLHIPFSVIAGPSAWLYFQLTVKDRLFEVNDLWHLQLPALVTLLTIISIYSTGFPVAVLNVSGKVVSILYLTALLLSVRKLTSNIPLAARISSVLIILNLAALWIGFAGFLFKTDLLKLTSAMALPLLIHIGLGIHLAYPETFRLLENAERKRMERSSSLTNVDLKTTLENVLSYLQYEKPWLEEDFSLSELADEMGLSSHQISELLNQHLGKSFHVLINELRVKEAKKLILESSDDTLIDIAFRSGFNSKASFNRNFRKVAGITPKEFRKKYDNSKSKNITEST